ncbi:DUF1287 domain-containing protein [Porticoccaceae bacterium LTM1]|nr:DUF1287 domain-containing protein [Porticoccaceae bacterium LTM1]
MNKLTLATILLLPITCFGSSFEEELVSAAKDRTKHHVIYDGSYVSISYPGGDVSPNKGVCTDVVIRSYRALGVDLQVLVHEDITDNFDLYPSKTIWGLSKADKNIDHRRVPNLQTFFSRYGTVLPITEDPEDYSPGDLVTWMLPGKRPHIGIVVDEYSSETGTPLIVHNVGRGPRMENKLFLYEITGHYRFVPEKYKNYDIQNGETPSLE